MDGDEMEVVQAAIGDTEISDFACPLGLSNLWLKTEMQERLGTLFWSCQCTQKKDDCRSYYSSVMWCKSSVQASSTEVVYKKRGPVLE